MLEARTPHELPQELRDQVLINLATDYANGYRAPDSSYQNASVLKQGGQAEQANQVLGDPLYQVKDS